MPGGLGWLACGEKRYRDIMDLKEFCRQDGAHKQMDPGISKKLIP